MAPWYYMSATLGEGGHTPYHPLLDDVPMEESQRVSASRLSWMVSSRSKKKAVDRRSEQADL